MVKGDIHDIGKNIAGTILRAGGFEVIDLGKNARRIHRALRDDDHDRGANRGGYGADAAKGAECPHHLRRGLHERGVGAALWRCLRRKRQRIARPVQGENGYRGGELRASIWFLCSNFL